MAGFSKKKSFLKIEVDEPNPVLEFKEKYSDFSNYIEMFTDITNKLQITVPNPKNPAEKMSLGDLFRDMYNTLFPIRTDSTQKIEYIFHFDKENTGSIPPDLVENVPDVLVSHEKTRQYSNTFAFYANLTPDDQSNLIYKIQSFNVYKQANKKLTKQICLYKGDKYFTMSGIACILHEICMQYYAYTILDTLQKTNENMEHIVIPKLYKIVVNNTELGNCISIWMDYVEPIPSSDVTPKVDEEFVEKWDPIIQTFFSTLEVNKIRHLDSKYENVFFTETMNNPTLAVIDFGESKIIANESNGPGSSEFGYPKRDITKSVSNIFTKIPSKTMTPDIFIGWINKSKTYAETYGGVIRTTRKHRITRTRKSHYTRQGKTRRIYKKRRNTRRISKKR